MPDESEIGVPENEQPVESTPQTIPEAELENGYYWATVRGLENALRQPVWVGFINGQPRVWSTGRRNSVAVSNWNIIYKLDHP